MYLKCSYKEIAGKLSAFSKGKGCVVDGLPFGEVGMGC